MVLALAFVSLILSAIPLAMFLANWPWFRFDDHQSNVDSDPLPAVSVLIPARDEENGIAHCLESVQKSKWVTLEIIVLDDDSSDKTPQIVNSYAQQDPRIQLVSGGELPDGWNGKQHACWKLAQHATHDRFLFLDADVRLADHAIASLLQRLEQTGVGLLSVFPHQQTQTWLEKLLIPMMHFILLGYLPFSRMRRLNDPSLAAGCGQLFLTTRDAYQQSGTHAAIRESRHDGIQLPRSYRSAGMMTDVIDGTNLAECRMYHNAKEVIAGLMKNATEGIANPRLIVVFTVLLLGCSVLPILTAGLAWHSGQTLALVIAASAIITSHLPRIIAAAKMSQSWFGAIAHVPATMIFLAIQWSALAGQLAGKRATWRGRN